MAFGIKHFGTITGSLVNWFSGNNSKLRDFNVGSSVRTMFEAVAVELEQIYYQLFVGITDGIQTAIYVSFNFPLLQSKPASGGVVFSRLSPAPSGGVTIPAGTQVSTAGVGGAAPVVYQTTDSVVILEGEESVSATVIATTTGSVGNAIAGAVNVLVGAPSGVDSVTNPTAFFTGQDLETSDKRETRFQKYIANLSRATLGAIENAALSVANVVDAVAFESPIMSVIFFSGITGYTDISFEANLPSGAPQQVLNPVVEANDALYIGAPSRFSVLKIDLDRGMVGGVYAWEYYSAETNGWRSLPFSSDSTSFLARSGYLSITKPSDWGDTVVDGVRKFFIRLRVTTPSTTQVATVFQMKASPFPGIIFLVAMDAAATLPPTLLSEVAVAVNEYRGAGKQVFVTGPTITLLNVTANVQARLNADADALSATLTQSIANWMSTFGLGQEFIVSQLVQFIRNQSTDILDVSISLPATNRDAAFDELFRAGTISIVVGQ